MSTTTPEVPTKKAIKSLRGKGPVPNTRGRVFLSTAPDEPSEVYDESVKTGEPKPRKSKKAKK